MREFADLPPKARQIMVASVMKAHQLLIDNLAAARGSRDDNDSLAGLIATFFSGILPGAEPRSRPGATYEEDRRLHAADSRNLIVK
jgi:hypothetical protein